MANRISGMSVAQKSQRFIFQRRGSESMGGCWPIFHLQVTVNAALIRKAGVEKTPQFKVQWFVCMYNT